MTSRDTLRSKATKYRGLTRLIGDRDTEQRVLELVDEIKRRALGLAKPDEQHIRIRPREIWE